RVPNLPTFPASPGGRAVGRNGGRRGPRLRRTGGFPRGGRRGGMRLLVAEDEQASAQALKELLELNGHQVIGPAPDGAEAVRLAGREHPDLAILDIHMPRLSGLEAIDQITRARPIPVIVLSAHSEPEYVDRATELPVFTYITKPAGAETLLP